MEDAARTLTYLSAASDWAVEDGQWARGAPPVQRGTGVAAAREAGCAQGSIEADLAAGERLTVDDAVQPAFGLLEEAG